MPYSIIYSSDDTITSCRTKQTGNTALDQCPIVFLQAKSDYTTYPKSRLPRVHDYYSLSHFKDGSGRFENADGHRTDLTQGQLILTLPGDRHLYGAKRTYYCEDFVSFIGPAADNLRNLGMLTSERPIHRAPHGHSLSDIIRFATQSGAEPQFRAGLMLQQFLLDMVTGHQDSSQESRLQSLIHQWEVDLARVWTVPDMAATCLISESHFRRTFGKRYGVSPVAYLERLRLTAAAELLHASDTDIATIGRLTGYPESTYFSKRFKGFHGLSPRQFRKLNL